VAGLDWMTGSVTGCSDDGESLRGVTTSQLTDWAAMSLIEKTGMAFGCLHGNDANDKMSHSQNTGSETFPDDELLK
jgi:hypothetical protein